MFPGFSPSPRGRLLLVVLTASVIIGCLAPTGLRAAGHAVATTVTAVPVAALPSNVRQLLNDLRGIKPGSVVTDEQKQTLAADLTALADGLVLPSASSVDQLADDLAAAAASGQLTHKVETLFAGDLATVLNAANLNPTLVRAELAEAQTILAAYGIDAADLRQLASDLEAIVDGLQTDSVTSQRTVTLRAENIPPLLLMNYSGRAKLVTVKVEGQAAQSVLSIETSGLPPANPFTVAVTRHSDGSLLVLGKLRVHTNQTASFPGVPGAGGGEIITPRAELDTHGETVFGGASGKGLPDGFDPADVETITLTDDNGTERLVGSFADDGGDLQSHGRLVNLRLDAGTADPGAGGMVSFRTKTTGAKVRTGFLLYVSGLPTSAAVTLVADGAAVGQFTTTTGGRLIILDGAVPVPTTTAGRMLPVNALPAAVDLNTLASLTLTDAAGNVLASGGL